MAYSTKNWALSSALFASLLLAGIAPGCQSADEDDEDPTTIQEDTGEPGNDATSTSDATETADATKRDTDRTITDDAESGDASDTGPEMSDEPVAELSACSSTGGNTVVISGTFEILGASEGFDPQGMRISENSVIEWRYNDESGGEHVIASGRPSDDEPGALFEETMSSFQHELCVEYNEVPESAGDSIEVFFHCKEHPENIGAVKIEKNF